MSASDALDDLLEILAVERRALRQLDGAKVLECAEGKERIIGILSASDLRQPELAQRWALAVAELRRNGVLLAHARACLREALGFATSTGVPTSAAALRGRTSVQPGINFRVSG